MQRKTSPPRPRINTSWVREAKHLRTQLGKRVQPPQQALPDDPVEFCRKWLHYEPYGYMHPFLRDQSHFIAVVQARQCMEGETLVITKEGRIRELKKIGFRCGKKALFRIVIRGGFEIRCSADHRIFTDKGWKTVDELKQNLVNPYWRRFKVRILNNSIKWEVEEKPIEEVLLAAYMLSDGSNRPRQSPKFTNTNLMYINEFEKALKRFQDVTPKRYEKNFGKKPAYDVICSGSTRRPTTFRIWCNRLFKQGIRYAESLPPEQCALFINRTYAADGYVSVFLDKRRETYRAEIGIADMDIKWAQYMRMLLLRFGIESYIKTEHPSGRGLQKTTMYRVVIGTYHGIHRFFETIGPIFGKEKQSKKAQELSKNGLSRGTERRRENPWRRVVSITPDGEGETWDITVEPEHWYNAQGVKVHNSGKTFNGMAKLLYTALRYPESTILVTAPKYDQVKRIAFKHLHGHLQRMKANTPDLYKATVAPGGLLKTIIRLRNGSVIQAESPIPETIRGHTAKTIYLMEMNFIRDDQDLYTAVLFTLNTTDGTLIAESTPWNTDSVFYRIFHEPEYKQFSKHTVPYTEALPPNGPLTPKIVEMIKEQLKGDPSRWRREMLCQWTEETDRWLPASLIALCQDQINYYKPDKPHTGNYTAGVDFGKKTDHSVIAVVERKRRHIYLRHLRSFKLDTPYGAVIGYIKRLQSTWNRLTLINCDQTGVGEYIVEDMKRSGIRNVQGTTFTQTTKEAMATALKETMRTATCPKCRKTSHIENNKGGEWNTTCTNCKTEQGNPQPLTPHLHIPYDPNLYAELNAPTYQLMPNGKIHYNHPPGTHDDKFWALALAVHAATEKNKSKPLAKRV